LNELSIHNITTVHRNCPLCDRDNRSEGLNPYSHADWQLKTCPQCDFVYIENAPDYRHLSTDTPWERTARIEESRRENVRGSEYRISKSTRWRLHILPRKKFPELLARYAAPGNVVDVGCGSGHFMRTVDGNFIPHGVEVSEALCREADGIFRRLGGYAVHAPSIEGLRQFPDHFFNAATLRSYLEHEMNPVGVLTEVYRTLKPGAVAILKVPNYRTLNRIMLGRNWCGFRFPDHLNYFVPASLREMGEKAGFNVRFGLTWKLPTSDNMYALLTRPAD